MQLSRKGWNNVVIYSMLFMLLLFGAVHRHITREPAFGDRVQLLPPGAVVLAIASEHGRIERVGPSWHSVPAMDLKPSQLDGFAGQWQALTVTRAEQAPAEPRLQLQLWLAGEPEPVSLSVLQLGQDFYLQSQQGLWRLPAATLPFLLPAAWLDPQEVTPDA